MTDPEILDTPNDPDEDGGDVLDADDELGEPDAAGATED
jgi:hypothetical protein